VRTVHRAQSTAWKCLCLQVWSAETAQKTSFEYWYPDLFCLVGSLLSPPSGAPPPTHTPKPMPSLNLDPKPHPRSPRPQCFIDQAPVCVPILCKATLGAKRVRCGGGGVGMDTYIFPSSPNAVLRPRVKEPLLKA
jgi:hypothetical protein